MSYFFKIIIDVDNNIIFKNISVCSFAKNKIITYVNKNNEIHRLGGPAIITIADAKSYSNYDLKLEYFENNMRHRDVGPAIIYYKKKSIYLKEYYQCGVLHRINGPAIKHKHYEIYYIEGQKMSRNLFVKERLFYLGAKKRPKIMGDYK